MSQPEQIKSERVLYRVAAVVDALGVNAAPGALLVAGGRIIAAGAAPEIGMPGGARVVDRPDLVVIPGLVNAHTHLDLSHIGPTPRRGSFVEWIEMIRARRCAGPQAIRESVERGIELSIAGGTAIVGDIAGIGSYEPIKVLRDSPLMGVSFLEVFGLGSRQQRAIEHLQDAMDELPLEAGGVALGLQPHAPYSCGADVYRWASQSGRPVSTHLLETPAEIELLRSGCGPLRTMLEQFGVWEAGITAASGPILEALSPALSEAPWLVAHVNYPQPGDLERLATLGATVVYCPRASRYFGHPEAGAAVHRYLDMLARGIPVALGTDSLVCLDTPDRISPLDEMRLLWHLDGPDPTLLLSLATVQGGRALGFEPRAVGLGPSNEVGALGIAVDNPRAGAPLAAAMRTSVAPEWLVRPPSGRSVKIGRHVG